MPLLVAFMLGGLLWVGAEQGHLLPTLTATTVVGVSYAWLLWRRWVHDLRMQELRRDGLLDEGDA